MAWPGMEEEEEEEDPPPASWPGILSPVPSHLRAISRRSNRPGSPSSLRAFVERIAVIVLNLYHVLLNGVKKPIRNRFDTVDFFFLFLSPFCKRNCAINDYQRWQRR